MVEKKIFGLCQDMKTDSSCACPTYSLVNTDHAAWIMENSSSKTKLVKVVYDVDRISQRRHKLAIIFVRGLP